MYFPIPKEKMSLRQWKISIENFFFFLMVQTNFQAGSQSMAHHTSQP